MEQKSLDQLIEEMEKNSERYDFTDEYIIKHGYPLPTIGEFSYGTSYTPTAWVLPYLIELRDLKAKMNDKVNK